MKFSDIPQFIKGGNYVVDIHWSGLEAWLTSQEECCASFELGPDFQRHHVWDEAKQSSYVEYILRGGESSYDLFFNCVNYINRSRGGKEGPMQLVDGKQRMEAVRKFLRNELVIFEGLMPYNSPLGFRLEDFEGRLGLGGPRFRIHVNNLQTRAEVLEWYLQLNSGGVIHTTDELDKVRELLQKENK